MINYSPNDWRDYKISLGIGAFFLLLIPFNLIIASKKKKELQKAIAEFIVCSNIFIN